MVKLYRVVARHDPKAPPPELIATGEHSPYRAEDGQYKIDLVGKQDHFFRLVADERNQFISLVTGLVFALTPGDGPSPFTDTERHNAWVRKALENERKASDFLKSLGIEWIKEEPAKPDTEPPEAGPSRFEHHWEGETMVLTETPEPTLDCPRSEERRVGKECRSRWSPYH